MSRVKKVEGECPSCGKLNSIMLFDLYYNNNKYPYARDIPICDNCDEDEILIRKINNRRFKVIGK